MDVGACVAKRFFEPCNGRIFIRTNEKSNIQTDVKILFLIAFMFYSLLFYSYYFRFVQSLSGCCNLCQISFRTRKKSAQIQQPNEEQIVVF